MGVEEKKKKKRERRKKKQKNDKAILVAYRKYDIFSSLKLYVSILGK